MGCQNSRTCSDRPADCYHNWCLKRRTYAKDGRSCNSDSDSDEEIVAVVQKANVRVLACGLDYRGDMGWAGKEPLNSICAFDMIEQLSRASQPSTFVKMWNAECTKRSVLHAIQEVGGACEAGDYFVFYYTGHADVLSDDETDSSGSSSDPVSAFCLLGLDGQVEPRSQTWLREDVFSRTVVQSVDARAHVVVVADFSHFGPVVDITKPIWAGRNAICMTGCADRTSPAKPGVDGIFTRALTKAAQDLHKDRFHGFSTSRIYKRTLERHREFELQQDPASIRLSGCGRPASQFPWPLVPRVPRGAFVALSNTKYREMNPKT